MGIVDEQQALHELEPHERERRYLRNDLSPVRMQVVMRERRELMDECSGETYHALVEVSRSAWEAF